MLRTRAIRVVLAGALATMSLSGCAVDAVTATAAGGALDAQAAAGGQQLAVEAQASADRAELLQVAQEAGLYATLNSGTTAGFAAEFSASEPATRAKLTSLTDTSAQIVVTAGRCETVTLPGGSPADGPC